MLQQLFSRALRRSSARYATKCRLLCTRSDRAELGDRVEIHHVIKSLTKPEAPELDSRNSGAEPEAAPGPPLKILLGSSATLRAIEHEIVGLATGETKSFNMSPAEAFGEHRRGMPVKTQTGNVVVVDAIDAAADGTITFDPNHPFAGHCLQCDVEVMHVVKAKDLAPADRLVLPEMNANDCKDGDRKTFPRRGDKCVLHYSGTLAATGAEFDSSRHREQPFEFNVGVGMVIRGWDEGVLNMSLGQRAMLRIPSQKAYGGKGAGNSIPPDSDLIFDVELLDIVRAGPL